MKSDETICLNSKVNGKQPRCPDRIYWGGGCYVAITSGWKAWVLYEEDSDRLLQQADSKY